MAEDAELGAPLYAPPNSRIKLVYNYHHIRAQASIKVILDNSTEDRLNLLLGPGLSPIQDEAVNEFRREAAHIKRCCLFWSTMVFIITPHLIIRQIRALKLEEEMYESIDEEPSTEWATFNTAVCERLGAESDTIMLVNRFRRAYMYRTAGAQVPSSCLQGEVTFDPDFMSEEYSECLDFLEEWRVKYLPVFEHIDLSLSNFREKAMNGELNPELPPSFVCEYFAEGAMLGEYRYNCDGLAAPTHTIGAPPSPPTDRSQWYQM